MGPRQPGNAISASKRWTGGVPWGKLPYRHIVSTTHELLSRVRLFGAGCTAAGPCRMHPKTASGASIGTTGRSALRTRLLAARVPGRDHDANPLRAQTARFGARGAPRAPLSKRLRLHRAA